MLRPQTPTLNRRKVADVKANQSAGFSLLETVVAMFVLTIGLLALASTIGFALMVSNSGRGITNSKLLVVSVLEQMETLRNNGQLTFGQIANTGDVDNRGAAPFVGFQSGFQPISINPGPDGIFGTTDDLTDAGLDNKFGTLDDFRNPSLARGGFSREILITPLGPQLKRIQVTIRYSVNGRDQRELVGVSYLNDNSRSNYLQ